MGIVGGASRLLGRETCRGRDTFIWRSGFASLALVLSLAPIFGCGGNADSGRGEPIDLFRQLEQARAIALRVDDPELTASANAACDRLAELGWALELADADQPAPRVPSIRVGTFDALWATGILERLGLSMAEEEVHLVGRNFRAAETLLIATLPDPERPSKPLTVVLASKPTALAFGLERVVPGWRASAFVWLAGDLRLELGLDASGRPRRDRVRDVDPPWRTATRSYRPMHSEEARLEVRVARDVAEDHAAGIVAALTKLRGRVQEWAPPKGKKTRSTRLVLDSTVDRLVGYPVTDAFAFADAWPGRVVALTGPGIPDASGAAAARLWLTERWGAPARTWIGEGAAIERADRYWDRALEEWAARLLRAGTFATIGQLVEPDRAYELSPHERAPARALLVRHLFEERGLETLSALWRGSEALVVSPELEDSFARFVKQAAAGLEGPAPDHSIPRLRGAAFANELDPSARLRRGWGTAPARESLEGLQASGASAVSLCGTYVDRGDRGDGRPFLSVPASGALDGDVALALTVAEAHRLGLAVALEFEFLARPSGTWAGDLKHLTGTAWQAFFERYGRALRHYALLAELLEVELFCVGSGLAKAVATEPPLAATSADKAGANDPAGAAPAVVGESPRAAEIRDAKREAWGRLIADARALYRGPLTLSTPFNNLHRVGLWGQLDAVGVVLESDLRLSAAEADEAGRDSRNSGADLWPAERFARTVDRPAIISRIGFRSTERAESGTVDSGGLLDLHRQAELYQELATTLRLLEKTERAPHGAFVWKWSSDPDAGGTRDRGYSPQGKPAAQVLDELFE